MISVMRLIEIGVVCALTIACGDSTSKGLYGVSGQRVPTEDAGENEGATPPPPAAAAPTPDQDEPPARSGPCDQPDDKGDHDKGKDGDHTGGC